MEAADERRDRYLAEELAASDARRQEIQGPACSGCPPRGGPLVPEGVDGGHPHAAPAPTGKEASEAAASGASGGAATAPKDSPSVPASSSKSAPASPSDNEAGPMDIADDIPEATQDALMPLLNDHFLSRRWISLFINLEHQNLSIISYSNTN